MNIVIPIAGQGSRFISAGYNTPKPFIKINGVPMIELVLRNLKIVNGVYTILARKEHIVLQKDLFNYLSKIYNLTVIPIHQLTDGAACTILYSIWDINSNEPLLLANSDQLIDIDVNDFIDDSEKRNLDGSILTFKSNNPKWSYAKINDMGYVTKVKEKQVISDNATVGLYYFKKGRCFVNSAIEMIINNDRYNHEFYTAPCYNYIVKAGLTIGVYNIDKNKMHGLGTPEDLETYIKYKEE